jgi:hypothetical protein
MNGRQFSAGPEEKSQGFSGQDWDDDCGPENIHLMQFEEHVARAYDAKAHQLSLWEGQDMA